jgi:hypothetical protein
MSRHQSRRSRRSDKGEASAESLDSSADNEAPMERFKSLTRSLLTVSNSQLKDEQLRHQKAKGRRSTK